MGNKVGMTHNKTIREMTEIDLRALKYLSITKCKCSDTKNTSFL